MINYARDAWNDPVVTEAYTYGYYTDGNQRMKTDAVSGKKTVYVYDAAGRLTNETESANGTVTQTYVYTYDASGNRLTLTASGNESYTVNYTYDKANRLLTEARTENGAAGPKRNMEMAKEAEFVIAFWNGSSRGTKNMIDAAAKLHKTVFVKMI